MAQISFFRLPKHFLFLILYTGFVFITGCRNPAPNSSPSPATESTRFLNQWFAAWDNCKKLLPLPDTTSPACLFYDSVFVYSTLEACAPKGEKFEGPSMAGQHSTWYMAPHHGQLLLPNQQTIPFTLMSFAGEYDDGKPFFVMAAPSVFKGAGVRADKITTDQLLTGVFLHEFTHTMQKGFGTRVDSIESGYKYAGVEMTDNIVQEFYKHDTAYTKVYLPEIDLFYRAAIANDIKETKELASRALAMYHQRHQRFFVKDRQFLKALDDIFLSMEGTGQFVAVVWLSHPDGEHIARADAIAAVRRNKKQWSQEEGLAMCLVAERLLGHNWISHMFGNQPVPLPDLLSRFIPGK